MEGLVRGGKLILPLRRRPAVEDHLVCRELQIWIAIEDPDEKLRCEKCQRQHLTHITIREPFGFLL